MSKKFNKNIQYTFNPQITLPTSSVLTATHNSNTIGNIFTTGGNVGIGTTSPSTKLHLRDNGSVTLLIEADADNVTETDVVTIKLRQDGGGQAMDIGIDSVNQSYIDFGTGNAGVGTNGFHIRCSTGSMLMITTSGNVGIGTTDPLYSLQVDGNVALNVMPGINSVGSIKIGRQDFNARWHMINCNNGTAASLNNMIFNLHDATTSTTVAPVLTLRGDGNVGIGTTSPSSNLEISGFAHSRLCIGSSASATIDLLRGGTNTFGVDGNGDWRISNSGGTLFIQTGLNSTITESMRIVSNNITIGNSLFVNGSLSKGSGTFDIPHPIDANKRLIHSFIEGPRCDLIYRGTVNLQNGTAQVNLDKDCVQENDCQMTSGTFESLCRHPVKYLHNNTSFNRIKGSISGNILTIICEDQHSNDSIDWMVIAERKDQIIYEWDKTNTNGYLQTEYTKYNN